MSSTKDDLLFRLTEELGENILELDEYVGDLLKIPGSGINKAHIDKIWRIRSKATRLKRIQTALLNIQKIEKGELVLAKNENSLRGIIIDVLSTIKHIADYKNVKIRIEILNDVICECDKNKMESVLQDLVINSIDFCPEENGEIIITLKPEEDMTRITIKDNGIGIVRESIDKIFDADYQMKLAVKREHIESGLALPVCKAIVEAHKGKLYTESKGTDFGTEMHVILPLKINEGIRKIE